MPYAVVMGEALVDLFESECDGEHVYRPAVGGAPLNVATGIVRLGQSAEFVGSIGSDAFGDRIERLLAAAGVGRRGLRRVDGPTTLAVTSLRNGIPDFHFYGEPPSYAYLGPDDLAPGLVEAAGALYCGSIALMRELPLAAAREAWSKPGPLRALDPNVRPTLLTDPTALRAVIEEFAATADLVKLSEPDGRALFGLPAERAAAHLRGLGAGAVVVTLGERGAVVDVPGSVFAVPAPPVAAIDTTGAGDASMAALIHGLLASGRPADPPAWRDLVSFATTAAALACEVRGGANAMPTLARIADRANAWSP